MAAAAATRAGADGSVTSQLAFRYEPAHTRNVPAPIDRGSETDQVFLVLYGTGWRLRTALSGVAVQIGGQTAEVLYAGEQAEFAGLDQINVRVPRSLAGRGEVELAVTVDGKAANILSLDFGGPTPAPRITRIAPSSIQAGQTVADFTVTGDNLLGVFRIPITPAAGVTATVLRTTATTVMARIAVAADAAAGDRQIAVGSERGESNRVTLTIAAPVPAPRITALTPASAMAGQTVADFAIDGQNLGGVTAVEFSPAIGITVSDLKPTATRVAARLVLAADAAAGTRQVTVVSPGGRSNTLSFEVRPRPTGPTIESVTPNNAERYRTNPDAFVMQLRPFLELTFTGVNLAGATGIEFTRPDGITVISVRATDTTVTASVQISENTPLGQNGVVVRIGQTRSNQLPFEIKEYRSGGFVISNLRGGPAVMTETRQASLTLQMDFVDPSGSLGKGVRMLLVMPGTYMGEMSVPATGIQPGQTAGTLSVGATLSGTSVAAGAKATIKISFLFNKQGMYSNGLEKDFDIVAAR